MGEPRDEFVLLVEGEARDSYSLLRKELATKRHKKHKKHKNSQRTREAGEGIKPGAQAPGSQFINDFEPRSGRQRT
jgi:hypothetical protein